MRLAIIGCMVMNREISHLVSESRHVVRVWWLRQGLHDTPDVLRTELQHAVDEIGRENERLPESLRFEAVILAYGLCSNGVIGLRSRALPVVVPRVRRLHLPLPRLGGPLPRDVSKTAWRVLV